MAWAVIGCAGAWWLHNARLAGVAAAGLAMSGTFSWALWQMSGGRMPTGVATYTISGLSLLLVMGLSVPELSLMFTLATFIFLAFGLTYLSGRASMRVVALTVAVALALLLSSVAAEGLRRPQPETRGRNGGDLDLAADDGSSMGPAPHLPEATGPSPVVPRRQTGAPRTESAPGKRP